MSKLITCLFALSLLMANTPLNAQENRPKIGYAFAGGGAKGVAHIGILKVLEEQGIRPDYITGTSIGAIMGGLYAIGYSVEELEELALGLDWEYYFSDELSRTDLPIEERASADRYQLKLPIENGKISLPKGFVKGQKIGLLLSQITAPAHGISDFNDFPIPFKCVATDFETGQAVILEKGSLAKAMRASMSLPSIFEPMEIDGKLLIDGGVVQNLPVKEVKDMGADIVIALDITSSLYSKEEVTSLFSVMEQASSYRLAEGVEIEKKRADIVIHPNIEGIGILDFDKGDTLIALGEQAARAALPEILALIKNHGKIATQKLNLPKSYQIQDISIKGISKKQQRAVSNIVQVRTERDYSVQKIENRIKKLFGSQFFKDAYFEFVPTENGVELEIEATPQSGEYIQLSANYDSDLKAGLLLNATFRNRILTGSKFSLDFKLSENPNLLVDYMVYTPSRPNIGLHLGGKFNHFPAFFYEEDGSVDEAFNINHYDLRMDIFTGVNYRFLASGGIGLEQFFQRGEIFDKDTEDLKLSQAVLYLSFLRDTYDRADFPKGGSYLALDGKFSFAGKLRQSNEGLESNFSSFNQFVRLQANKIFPIGDYLAIKWYNDVGIIRFEKDNYLNLFYLGRAIPGELTHVDFVGLDYMELPVTSYFLTGLKLRAELKPNIFGAVSFNYGQTKVEEYLNVVDGISELIQPYNKEILGLGIEGGLVTPLGPARITAEYNLKEKRANFSLHLGYLF